MEEIGDISVGRMQ